MIKDINMMVVVQSLSHVQFFVIPWTASHFPVLHYLLEFCSNSGPLSQGGHPTILSSVVAFYSCLRSFPASALASFLPMNSQDWFPLGLTGLLCLLSKGLSRIFSSTTVQRHQFFSAQPSFFFLCQCFNSKGAFNRKEWVYLTYYRWTWEMNVRYSVKGKAEWHLDISFIQ